MILLLVGLLLISVYLLVKRQYSHWEAVGIPSARPKIPFGNLQSVARKERSFGTAIYDIYKETNEPFLGIYLFFRPALLLRDPEIISRVLRADFQHFHDRGVYCDPKRDPMSATLFSLSGDAWKTLRSRLTPAFTSGKLKGMFPIVKTIGAELVTFMKPLADKGETIDIRDLAGRYVIDCLASIAFGQDNVSTLKEPDHQFRTNGKKLNDNSNFIDVIRRAAVFVCPK